MSSMPGEHLTTRSPALPPLSPLGQPVVGFPFFTQCIDPTPNVSEKGSFVMSRIKQRMMHGLLFVHSPFNKKEL